MASVEPSILEEGAEYYDFEAFSAALRSWEIRNCVSVYVRCSRTLEAAKKRVPKRRFNPRLQYYDLQYACIHGGRKFKTRSRGDRPNQTSFVKNCPFTIKVTASSDGEKLVVKGITHAHNHEISEGTFQSLPKQRRLNKEEWQSMNSILAAKPTMRSLQSHIRKSTGKMVTLRDLSNHAVKLRKNLVKLDEMKANDTTAPISPSFADERTMETSDMYRQAFCEAQKLATMASEVSVAKFKQRLAVLSDLVNLWEMDVEAAVTGISDEVTDSHILAHVPQPGVFDNSTTCELNSVEDSKFNISVVEDIPSSSGQSSSGLNGRQGQKNIGGEVCGLKSKGQVF